MSERRAGEGQEPVISASEVGHYAYCARAWWLHRALGYTPRNVAALEQGTRRHEEHGRAVVVARRQMAAVGWLLVLALAIALATAVLLILQLIKA